MFYLDASLVVAALASEQSTHRVQNWLTERSPGQNFLSPWVITEVSSALSIKLRMGQIDITEKTTALASFGRLVPEVFGLVDVHTEHFRSAARFADRHTLSLRAGDALHLAIAADHGLILCTLDRRLAEAGPPLGIPTVLV